LPRSLWSLAKTNRNYDTVSKGRGEVTFDNMGELRREKYEK